MTVAFCGHSDFQGTNDVEMAFLSILERNVGDEPVEFYLGGSGGFDAFALECCKKYREVYKNALLVYVSPYIEVKGIQQGYDAVIYPEIEKKPLRFAVVYRNRYMIDKADMVVAFISRPFGGAYKTYSYAKRKKKKIFNLAEIENI